MMQNECVQCKTEGPQETPLIAAVTEVHRAWHPIRDSIEQAVTPTMDRLERWLAKVSA